MSEGKDILHAALKLLVEERAQLSRQEARQLCDAFLEVAESAGAPGYARPLQVAAILGALAARGETTAELAGFVDSLRAHLVRVQLSDDERSRLVDTCGTGGDLSGTFNISTAAALVAAAAGSSSTGPRILVAKHGNRAVTSQCGSADVLEALGIPVSASSDRAAEMLRRHGFAFLLAPSMQPAMKALMPIRRALGVRTAFNILGPMTNPAGAAAQVMGVYAARLVPIVAETLAALDTRHAFVVHGAGLDEFSISGESQVAEVRGAAVRHFTLAPEQLGLTRAAVQALAGGDARTNAAILTAIFAGERGPRRDVVVLNAGAVLVTAGMASDLAAGLELAGEAIDCGAVTRLVAELRDIKS